LFYEGCWPSAWKYHLIVPIFKKGAAFMPGNYRGVHLTTILSKIAEKMISINLMPFLQHRAFGENQWAFTPTLSARDLVTTLVLSWILAVCAGKKVGTWLSDISGAFDRVFKPYLLAKLNGFGVGPLFLNFLDSYLSPRQGQVVVQGAFSDLFTIADSVFQGTVMGPMLWNSFFSDVAIPAKCAGGSEKMFADDLSVFQEFDRSTPVPECKAKLSQCESQVHKWGRQNRVSFDAAKEHTVILHPLEWHGEAFKLLGCMIDPDMRMRLAVE